MLNFNFDDILLHGLPSSFTYFGMDGLTSSASKTQIYYLYISKDEENITVLCV